MKLRAPSTPLITVDPYFSVWMPADRLTDHETVHWTGKKNTINGYVTVDGEKFRFMGRDRDVPEIEQIYSDISALVTDYVFSNESIILHLSFYTPLFPDDLHRISRPVSYLTFNLESVDGREHKVSVEITASEELCVDLPGKATVAVGDFRTPDGLEAKVLGNVEQKVLNRSGDDLRIDWGYFYLCGPKGSESFSTVDEGLNFIGTRFALSEDSESTVLFAYDDIKSIEYFGSQLDAYWKLSGKSFGEILDEASAERSVILDKCRDFSDELYEEAVDAGGEKYAELVSLAYRQVIAAHKLVTDNDGKVLFISKECFSNGCAATVDVTYPSSPLFLRYNTELLKGTMRPVFRYALSDTWPFDFAPHDAGQYPLVNGQVYGGKPGEHRLSSQMPVEECGNMIILAANICFRDGNTEFFDENEELLKKWVGYLCEYGEDPENQLCTDDFAGHLAHNCNLSLKAIMGVAGFAAVMKMKGNTADAEKYSAIAKKMADSWLCRAADETGSFRLAFDRPDTFSMKYNMVWDKLWGTKLFPPYAVYSEIASNKKHFHVYGMPLDNRRNYTKSDWIMWTACLAPTQEDFEEYITPMYNAYNVSLSRVPMTDWYDTDTAQIIGFQNRTVQGGLFIKMLEYGGFVRPDLGDAQ